MFAYGAVAAWNASAFVLPIDAMVLFAMVTFCGGVPPLR